MLPIKEIMEALGIDPIGLLAQILNFILIVWVLKKFLYGPVLKVLHDRKNKIAKSMDDVKEIEERLRKVEETVDEKIKKANTNADEILREAKKSGEEVVKAAEGKAEEQTKKIIVKAEERLQSKEMDMMRKMEDKVADLAMVMIKKSLSGLDNKTKTAITKSALKEAGKVVQ